MGNKKLQVWLPLLFSVVMIGGMYFGFKMKDQSGTSFFKTEKRTALQETLDLIKQKYVDSIGVDTLQENAIQDIVNELDPHSVYIPPTNVQDVNDDIMGRFEGIGVEFNIFSDTVNIAGATQRTATYAPGFFTIIAKPLALKNNIADSVIPKKAISESATLKVLCASSRLPISIFSDTNLDIAMGME